MIANPNPSAMTTSEIIRFRVGLLQDGPVTNSEVGQAANVHVRSGDIERSSSASKSSLISPRL